MVNNKQTTAIDKQRYRRIVTFFARLIGSIIFWDLLVRRIPIIRWIPENNRLARYRVWSAKFRVLALEMGGVLIKLGQFLSARVDILPLEVTDELKGLQDEVPPVESVHMFDILHDELGNWHSMFEHIDPHPLAAASLGQVYRAKLLTGNDVVIKIQRPNIEYIVRTDLEALRVVAKWIMRYEPIRRRANVPNLMEEFAITLWEELDYKAEVANAERFADMYASNSQVYIPAMYKQYCTSRVIVQEDVESLKITDRAALEVEGIDPKEVADCLFNAYFQQIFEERFFHADPHPGNLFVRPRYDVTWEPKEEGALGRPFWLIFIDFGMVGRIPERVNNNLAQLLISVSQQDARALTEAYNNLGFFLPNADLERITEAQEEILERVWGRNLLELASPDPAEVEELGNMFRDLLFDFPFQIPQDFIYLGRAIGIVSGLVSSLNPTINPWYQIEKYGTRLFTSQATQQITRENVLSFLRPYLDTPRQVRRLIEVAENGRLRVQTKPSPQLLYRLERLDKRLGQLSWSVLGAAGILAATLLKIDKNKRESN